MKPSSRLLICKDILRIFLSSLDSRLAVDEYVLASTARSPSGSYSEEPAPEPLLANYGLGRIRRYNLDMLMLSMFSGGERTLQDWIDLG